MRPIGVLSMKTWKIAKYAIVENLWNFSVQMQAGGNNARQSNSF
jgi:hypothetical protein